MPVQPQMARTDWYVSAMERLVDVVQALSHAHSLEEIMGIVRRAARDLTGADGATFVLRDGDKCYYAEENAISPLWKGQRFPMKTCISGWVMLNAAPAVIEDIYADERIPAAAYRPTFVKSLAMVPIRKNNPVGAIGNYWAQKRRPTEEELAILQALANVTSVAIENAELYSQLQQKVRALEESNHELGRFAWIASHDLKSPLRAIDNLAQWIGDDLGGKLQGDSKDYLDTLRRRVRRMEKLLDDVLHYAQVEREPHYGKDEIVAGDALAEGIRMLVDIPPGFTLAFADDFKAVRGPHLALQRIFCNLISNAVTHHDKKEGRIEVGVTEDEARYIFTVRDDGPGIPPEYHQKIFEMFQTLQSRDVREGSGIGLSIVKKIVALNRGEIEVESDGVRGTAFRLTWPKPLEMEKN